MPKVMLIQPKANRFDTVTVRIPNGLLHVAAPLVQANYEVIIIDQRLQSNWADLIRQQIGPDLLCVGLTCSTGQMIAHALEISQLVKQLAPDLPVVWGGPHASLLPEQTLESSAHIDLVVVNEGDDAFMELVQAIEARRSWECVAGLYYKDPQSQSVRATPARGRIQNLDRLAPLPYHLVPVERYSSIRSTNRATRSIDLVSSRGCPFDCKFCSVPFSPGRAWKAKTVERMIEEIKYLKATYQITEFYYVDDNFFVDIRRVEAFAARLIAEKMDILWGIQGVRVESLLKSSDQLLDLLERAGLTELSVGVESGNLRILEMVDKGIDLQDVLQINRRLARRSFQVKYNFIIGFPTETIDEVKKTIDFCLKLYQENPRAWFPFNIYTPFPGTKLYQFAVQLGFVAPQNLIQWIDLEASGRESSARSYIDSKTYQFLQWVNFTSYLAFPIAKTKISNGLFRFLFSLYRPFAYYRFRYSDYRFYLEKYLKRLLLSS